MQQKNHIIIIGSGLGGLTTAYILAKNGYRVTVLEKNAQFGGCLQTFVRHGVKFETGMHYIGSMDKGQVLYNFFKYLALLPDVKLHALDKNAYDIISIDGQRFPFANGTKNFVEQLSQFFPDEKQNLKRYWNTIHDVAHRSPLYSGKYNNEDYFINPDYFRKSASGFIESITDNRVLQQVLAGNVPLYAGVRDRTPLYIHALIEDFYNNSAYRIIGGSDAIAKSLVNSIKKMGGEVHTNSPVAHINCDTEKAVSVTLQNGEEVSGDYFISNLHPARMVELLDTHLIRKSYRTRIAELKNTVANFTLYIRFKKEAMPYLNSNFYHYRSDVWEGGNYRKEEWPNNFLYMHLCNAATQQYAEGAILMTYMNFDEVAQWQGTRIGHRGTEYETFKQQRAERLIDLLETQMPGTRACIENYYASTPLTYLDYTGTERGSMYGIASDCTEHLRTQVSQRTKIPNLFQTGQNINSHGILGVIIGAMITSSELLGIENVVKQVRRSW
jgi:all-trans-retinol 13,14-reductase